MKRNAQAYAARPADTFAGCVCPPLRRAARGLATVLAMLLALCVLLPAALPGSALAARADSGDLDEILNYEINVTPAADGTLSMACAIDWKVLDDSSYGPLEWVQIGIPNDNATSITAETDTIDSLTVEDGYMKVYFDKKYYEGDVVHFAFHWTQSWMYTKNEDGSLFYDYTPGWFDEACVDSMRLTWNSGDAGRIAAFTTSGGSAEAAGDAESPTAITLTAENLGHGQTMSLTVTYGSWGGTLAPEAAMDNADTTGPDDSSDLEDLVLGILVLVFITGFIIIFIAALSSASWQGGFGAPPAYVYVAGLYYPRGHDGHPVPGSVGRPTPPPAPHGGFGGMGGGSSHGGGAGRGGGGCACASSCACACACACAGGGRAGCSAKNLYGAIHLPETLRKPDEEQQ